MGTIRLNKKPALLTWFRTRGLYSSETEKLNSRFSQLLQKEYNNNKREDKNGGLEKELFYKWLVGFTDGDGCFNVYTNIKNQRILLTFKISQKANNIQVLHYIKNQLGVGSITQDKKGMAHFLIRDKNTLEKIIIPIFNKYSLLTSKADTEYLQFRQSLNLWNTDMPQKDKINNINKLKSQSICLHYVPSSWILQKNPITKPWLIGFIEAEGSFYLVLKSQNRLAHGFGITQKKDEIVLQGIKKILKIEANVKWNKKGFYSVDSTNSKSLKWIKDYFLDTMKGRKSLEYRIWARSFRDKGKFKKLSKIKKIIEKIRNSS